MVLGTFNEYERDVDNALRTKSKDTKVSKDMLEKYKKNFVDLVNSA